LLMLSRFVPWNARELEFSIEPPKVREKLTTTALALRGALGGLVALAVGALTVAALDALKAMKGHPEVPFDLLASLRKLLAPADQAAWLTLVGLAVFALFCGVFTAAVAAARHGQGEGQAEEG